MSVSMSAVTTATEDEVSNGCAADDDDDCSQG